MTIDKPQDTAEPTGEASALSAGLERCATCAHWGNNMNYADDNGRRLRSCVCPKFSYGYHHDDNDVPDDGASIEDDEGWGMLTGPAFGCIHWVRSNDKVQPGGATDLTI